MGNESINEDFSTFWRTWYPKLLGFSFGFSYLNREDREDGVQEILEKVWARRQEYRATWALSTWVYTLARNHFIDLQRKNFRHSQHLEPDSHSTSDLPSTYSGPEDDLVRNEEDLLLARALATLSDIERQVLHLRLHQNLDYRSMSKITGKKEGTLKSLHHRAIERLKHEVGILEGRINI